MDYYLVSAPAISRRGVAGFITVFSSERDSEINDQLHDAFLMREACRRKRVKQTAYGVREYVDKDMYCAFSGNAFWTRTPVAKFHGEPTKSPAEPTKE